ncbi:MAG: hypothetical protein ACK401_02365 [Archaeoglobaceae archaeon]
MIYLLEPLKKVVIEDLTYSGEEIHQKRFGGFCDCGGKMFQKLWVKIENTRIMISECEKCWNHSAYFFNSSKFLRKENVHVIEKNAIADFLKNYLTDLEIEALIARARDKVYKPADLSRAKKKLSDMNISLEEILAILK